MILSNSCKECLATGAPRIKRWAFNVEKYQKNRNHLQPFDIVTYNHKEAACILQFFDVLFVIGIEPYQYDCIQVLMCEHNLPPEGEL
jgi:hypothetical protein